MKTVPSTIKNKIFYLSTVFRKRMVSHLFLDGYWFHVFEDKVCVLLDLALGFGLYQSGGQETEEDNLQAKHINGLREYKTAGISEIQIFIIVKNYKYNFIF